MSVVPLNGSRRGGEDRVAVQVMGSTEESGRYLVLADAHTSENNPR